MSDLREQLADRLSAASGLEYSDDYPDTFEPFLSMADECIRQMEWARTLHGERWEGDGRDGTRHIVNLDDQPLTLAPEDWKP